MVVGLISYICYYISIILLNIETLGSKHTSRSLLYVPMLEKLVLAIEEGRYSLVVATLIILFLS
jgi:hypothetical protein